MVGLSPWAKARLRLSGRSRRPLAAFDAATPSVDDGAAAAKPKPAEVGAEAADGAAAPRPDLPDFAKTADDLEALKKAVDDAAAVGGGLWFSYVFTLFYLAVAAGAVTHADLFFEKPITLLLLNVQVPIVAFFALAPILFLALHAYTLAHLVMLTEKTKAFHCALYAQIGETGEAGEDAKRKVLRDGLRGQLPSNVFVQVSRRAAGHARRRFRSWAAFCRLDHARLRAGAVAAALSTTIPTLP